LADTLKKTAVETITQLQQLGLRVIMMTGDNLASAQNIAQQLHCDDFVANVLPAQKAAALKKMQTEQSTLLAMVGDGINDAPALVQADIGFALGSGTDIALEAADITLLGTDLNTVPKALTLSQKTMNVIKQNLFWAFFYNVLLIPVAAGVFYSVEILPSFIRSLHPMLAALAMSLSSITVVLNSLRLRSLKL
jgi:P-type E1-E2 ATPase